MQKFVRTATRIWLARSLCNSVYRSVNVTGFGSFVTRSPIILRRQLSSTTGPENETADSVKTDYHFPIEGILTTPSVDRISPDVVRDSIERVFLKQIPGLCSVDSAQSFYSFVDSNLDSLLYLDTFIRLSCSTNTSGIALLTPIELTNTLFMLKDQVKKGKYLKTSCPVPDTVMLESMIESFLILLLNRKSPQVSIPIIVGGILKSHDKRMKFQKLFAAGLGNFLPEISMLPKQFTLSNLQSFDPILDGISWLDQEFSHYFHNFHREFDEIYFKTLIPVMRYRHLLSAFRNLSSENVIPSDLISLIDDPIAIEVQSVLQEVSGKISIFDQLIFQTHRNMFNLLFCATGLGTFEKIFAVIARELQSKDLLAAEKELLIRFLQDFLPLLCSGALSSTQLGNVKYTCVIARFQENVLVPYKCGNNVFENYEISLLILLDLAEYAYLLRAVSSNLKKPFERSSLMEIEKAVITYSEDKGFLVQQDAERLINASKVYAAYSLRSFTFWDQILLNKCLTAVMEQQEQRHQHISELTPEIQDLLNEVKEANSDIAEKWINLEPYSGVLANIQDYDLKISYTSITPRVLLRLVKDKIDQQKSDESATFDQLKALCVFLEENIENSGLNMANLDGIASNERIREAKGFESQNDCPSYVQIPEFLKIHEFHEEMVALKEKVLLKNFKDATSNEIIKCLKDEVEAMTHGLSSHLASRVSKKDIHRYAQLANRLTQLFMINGGDTEILDTVISSEQIFMAFENKLLQKKKVNEALVTSSVYLQLPDNCPLHTFVDELINLRSQLGGCFSEYTSKEVLDFTEHYLSGLENLPSYGAYHRLHQNLVRLLNYNNGYTSILDALIVSDSALRKLEESLSKKRSRNETKNYTVASYQDELAQRRVLNSTSAQNNIPPIESSNKVECNGFETNSLRPQENTTKAPLVKTDLEQFLRKAKKEKVSEMEERFRERQAYVWSASTLRNLGTLESKQFFSQAPENKFPMFPGTDNNLEYLVLTSNGHVIYSKTNPLGATHISEDMLCILERLSESDIVNFSAHLRKLQRKGWNLIGSKGQNQMLVFSRSPKTYKSTILKTAKLLLSTAGFVCITLLGVDYFVGEKDSKAVHENEQCDVQQDAVNEPEAQARLASGENVSESHYRTNFWRGLFWK